MIDGPWTSCMAVHGLTPSECASWVQAWGTIAAIVATTATVLFQARSQRKAELKRLFGEDVRRLSILYGAVFNMRDKLKQINEFELGIYLVDWSSLDQAIKFMQSVPLLEIPDWTVSFALAHTVDCYAILRRHTSLAGDGVPPKEWYEKGDAMLARTIESIGDVEKHLGNSLRDRKADVPVIVIEYEDGPLGNAKPI